ncbi:MULTISPECIES: hypothetical protein [Streptomyces]|uniref:terpene synthase family protein n=1 Tax=Streptomyces TaxID=1883 RepID=UPI000A4B5F4F|nr:hypothetical protein [Streptomyces virginiae]
MKFQIPEKFPVPFSATINPYTGRVSQKFWEWIESEKLAPSDRSRERLRRSGIELASCYCWPSANQDELLEGMKWMFFFFRFDDQIEEGLVQRDFMAVNTAVSEIVRIMNGCDSQSNSPLAQSLQSTWGETKKNRPKDWVDSFRTNFCELIESYTLQARHNYNSPPEERISFIDYEEFREISFGMHWVYDYMESVHSRSFGYLSKNIRSSTVMKIFRRSSTLQQALLNDIFSAARESHQDRSLNSVILMENAGNCDPSAATHLILDRISQHLEIYEDARSELLAAASEGNERLAVSAFVENMDAVIGGNHDWHHIVMRYAVDDVASPQGAFSYPDDL